MKTVWAVEQGSYSDYHVVGVFTSKANADLIAKLGADASVVEWTLDPAVKELRAGMNQYSVGMLKDGTTEEVSRDSLSTYDLTGSHFLWKRTKAPATAGKGIPDRLNAVVWARNEKHAVKIVNEIRTRMIASGEWKD